MIKMYPTIEQYKDAIRIAEHSLATLQDYEPVLKADGEPWFSSGNFAVVFQMKHRQTSKRLALKCFTRHQERRQESYRLISEALAAHPSNYLLAYQYLDHEIWVSDHNGDGAEYPLVAMEWAEGMTLGDYVKLHCSEVNKDALQTLAHNFEVFCAWLIAQPFAHGDLKPDNIIVRENGSLALVDYDGMFVPTMQGQQAREFGSPIYRHPKRTLDTYDAHIDDFSLLVLLSELRLVAADPTLYNSSLSGESIVAKAGDWDNILTSRIYQAMQAETLKGSIDWASWAAMLLITSRSETHELLDWSVLVNTKKQVIEKPKIIQNTQLNTTFSENLGSGITLDMIFVEGGTFMMGSNDGFKNERPMHSVTLVSFWIGKYQVTQAQWEAIMCNNPSYFKGDSLPVDYVSWDDAQEFIKKLNQKTGKKYRLLTEAEWEYAARGGNKGRGYQYAGSNNIYEVAWFKDNSFGEIHPVGQKKANKLGVFDMSGNVFEWCGDWYDEDYYKNSPRNNPKCMNFGSMRVYRGGSSDNISAKCRVANRKGALSENRYNGLGFRLCLPVS
jgi:formylglycine-generating enzyme required for sulfatase activity